MLPPPPTRTDGRLRSGSSHYLLHGVLDALCVLRDAIMPTSFLLLLFALVARSLQLSESNIGILLALHWTCLYLAAAAATVDVMFDLCWLEVGAKLLRNPFCKISSSTIGQNSERYAGGTHA